MKFDYTPAYGAQSGDDYFWDLANIQFVPLSTGFADPIAVSYQGTTNPLETDTVVETKVWYEDGYRGFITGTFVYALEGTVSFDDGVYTANYTKTLVASDSTVISVSRSYNDLPRYRYEWSDGIAFSDVVGKTTSELITDGSVFDFASMDDKVTGTSAAEVFYLRGGNDRIDAKGGDDLIVGGAGQDRMSGGRGADIFAFEYVGQSDRKRTADVITDFVHGKDKINLELIDAKQGGGNQAFKFLGETDFSSKRGQLIFDHEGHGKNREIHVYADVNGDKKADFVVTLEGIVGLTASDFVL